MAIAIWTSGEETVEVSAIVDQDGDYDVRPIDSTDDPYANWTVYRSELDSGRVTLEFV